MSTAVICVLLLVGCTLGLAVAASQRPTEWTSSAAVLYGQDSSSSIIGSSSSDSDIDRLLATQTQVVSSDAVMVPAAKTLGMTRDDLSDATAAETEPDTSVLKISVTAPSAGQAARRTKAVADAYVTYTRQLAQSRLSNQAAALDAPIASLRDSIDQALAESAKANPTALNSALSVALQQQLQLQAAASAETGPATIISTAQTPTGPSSVSTKTAAVVGAGLGLLLALGLVLVVTSWRRLSTGHCTDDSTA